MPTTPRCPTCRQTVQWKGNPYRPFCSERCRIVDLGNWAAERYRVPGPPVPEEDAVTIESEKDPDDGN